MGLSDYETRARRFAEGLLPIAGGGRGWGVGDTSGDWGEDLTDEDGLDGSRLHSRYPPQMTDQIP